jgi:hypothetical protein
MATEYLVELVAYDPAVPGEITLRYSTHGKVTGPSETPAHTVYEARLKEPGDVRRAIYEGGDGPGPVRVALGEIVLTNLDGALDSLAGLHFDGRRITVRRGVVGGAYPSAYPAVYVGTMDDVEVTRGAVRVRLRDNAFGLDVPLQSVKFAGTNTGGAGLEGTAEIEGVPKPIVLGRVQQIAPVPVNTAKLIYQVSDGAVQSVDGVYDKGIPLVTPWPMVSITGPFSTNDARSVVYIKESGRFVAVGASGSIATSDDGGVSWTTRTAIASRLFTSVIVATNGAGVRRIVAGGTQASSPSNNVDYSTDDGVTWTKGGDAFGGGLYAVSGLAAGSDGAGGERIVAVGGTGAGGVIATSDNGGETWTTRTTGFGASDINAVTYSQPLRLWIAAGFDNKIATSPDGAAWTIFPSPFAGTTLVWQSIRSTPDAVWIGSTNGTLVTSRDGITFSPRESNNETIIDNICYADGTGALFLSGQYIATDNRTGRCLSLDGGASWTTLAGGSTARLYSVAFGGDRFVGVGAGGFFGYSNGISTAASLVALQDDDLAPKPGTVAVHSSASGSYIRLGSPPAGLITADVTQGAAVANRTAAELFKAVLTRAGYSASDWVAADLTALDTADGSELGLYIDAETSVIQALDQIAATVGAWWGVGNDGKFRIVRFTAPSGTPVLALTANDIVTIERLPSVRPSYSTKLQYARYYAPQDRDVALGVSDARRADIAREWREVVDTDTAVQTAHLLAVESTEPTLYQSRADALTEAARRQALRGVKRDRFDVVCELNDETEAVDVGDVVTVTHPRFGLSAGRDFRVVAVEPQRATKRLRLSLWA